MAECFKEMVFWDVMPCSAIDMCLPFRGTHCHHLTPWSESASELYRPSDRRLSAKRLPTCADRGCQVVIVTDPSGCILSVF
jgi:hypothetical protein